MSNLTIVDGVTEYGVTTFDGSKVIVSSRRVARVFGKRHDNVLRDIRDIGKDVTDQFWSLNFEESKYKTRGKYYPEFLLTKDGFTLLTMGFTGKKAMKFKIAYINQFNQMKELIKNRYFARIEYKPMMEALQESRETQGKSTSYFHYSNEANMLNRIVLGSTAKDYCEENNIDRDKLRDNLPEWQLKALHKLEVLNTDLIQMGLDYQQRKEMLIKKYNYMFNRLKLAS
ncbi:MAG: Rha family transcriptional regulator [Firmicutes bacterium]|nr:Rha family transcriptional regulator [Bacillota bacterium]